MAHKLGLILILIAGVFLRQTVNGLTIKQVCDRTPKQSECYECFSRGVFTLPVQFGIASVYCSTSHTEGVISDVVGILKATRDNAVRVAFESCNQSLNVARSTLYDSNRDVADSRFSDAYDKAVVASDSYSNCSRQIQSVPKPQTFSDHFSTLRNYYLNNEAIMTEFAQSRKRTP